MGEIESEQRFFEPSKGESGRRVTCHMSHAALRTCKLTFWAYVRAPLRPRIPISPGLDAL